MTRRQFLRLTGGIIIAGGVAAATTYTYAAFIEPTLVRYETRHIPIPGLPPALDGFRIIHLSDFHHNPEHQNLLQVEQAIQWVNSSPPDLIVLTGDFIDNNLDGLDEISQTLAALNARYGVFAVLGNHDHRQGAQSVKRSLEAVGITVLWNENVTLPVGVAALNLVGLDDWLRGRPQIRVALDGIQPDTTTIALVHEPDVADVLSQYPQIHLQLSGHSHGGQIRVPGIGPLILPILGQKYVQGYYEINQLRLYTTRGIGYLTNFPLRFNCPPELSELILVPA